MERPALLARVLHWLREGYPEGVPPKDYSPILALLRSESLTDDEIDTIVSRLIEQNALADDDEPISVVDTKVAITHFTEELPSEQDVLRVQQRLMEHGWPFDEKSPIR